MDSGVDRSPHSLPGNVTKLWGQPRISHIVQLWKGRTGGRCRSLDQVVPASVKHPPPQAISSLPCNPALCGPRCLSA